MIGETMENIFENKSKLIEHSKSDSLMQKDPAF